MARTNNLNNFLTDVANSIRNKTGSQESIQASDFDTEIDNIPTGGAVNLQDKNITINQNNVTTVTADSGYDGLRSVGVTVNVPTIDTSDATAYSKDLPSGKTAYARGEKITGIAGLLPIVKSTNIATFARADLFHDGSEVDITHAKNNIIIQTKNGVPLIGMITPSLAKDPDTGSDVLGLHIEGPKTAVSIKQSTMAEKLNIIPTNIKKDVTILGVTGSVEELNGETKTVKSTTSSQTITPSQGKNGITEITVEPISLQNKTVTPTSSQQTITADNGYDGLGTVTVEAGSSEYNASINTTANYKGSNKSSGINYCITSLPEIDFSNSSTNTSYAFYNMVSLTEILIKSSSTSNVTNMSDMFANCTSLITVPLFDTSSVTSMKDMFYGCSSLTTVPLFDTSSVTSMQNMLTICTSLTDTSLDNILQMCINAVNYTDTKTLSRLSLSPSYYPATKIEALPHYQDFIDAGWTIGY